MSVFRAALFLSLMTATAAGGADLVLPATPIQSRLQQELSAPVLRTAEKGYDFGADSKKATAKEDRNYGRKSGMKAAALSLLVPGLGQYYTGNRRLARYYFAVDAVSWLSLLAFRTYGGWKEDDYIRFAHDRAGADLEGKPDWFVDLVSYYDNIDQYNEYGRAIERDRPYLVDNTANHWFWQSSQDKISFRQIKNGSREAYRRGDFVIGVMVVDRLVSAIHAIHLARSTGKRLQDLVDGDRPSLEYRIAIDPFAEGLQLGLVLSKRF